MGAKELEEVLAPPDFRVSLELRAGGADIRALAPPLEKVIFTNVFLVPLDLLREHVRRLVQSGLRLLVVCLGHQGPGRQLNDGPRLVPVPFRTLLMTVDSQPNLLD